MTYWDLKPLSRKDEFEFLMQMRKPQTKIVVVSEPGQVWQHNRRTFELQPGVYGLSNDDTYKPRTAPTAVSLAEDVISAVQRTQRLTSRPNDPNCTHKKGSTSGDNDRQYWSCKTCDYFEEL